MSEAVISFTIGLIIILSLLLNGLVCYKLFEKYPKLNVNDCFIAFIAVIDIIQTGLGFIIELIFMYKREYTGLCKMSTFMVFSTALTVIMLCAMLSMIQCFAIHYPSLHKKLFTKGYPTYVLLSLCVMFGFFWPSMGFTNWTTYVLSENGRRCVLDWGMTNPRSISYLICVTLFSYVMPAIAIVITLWLSKRKIGKDKDKASSGCNNLLEFKKFRTTDEQYFNFVAALSALLVISWLPYAVSNLLVVFDYTPAVWILSVVAIFAKISSLANPIAICFIYSIFRMRLSRTTGYEMETEMGTLRDAI